MPIDTESSLQSSVFGLLIIILILILTHLLKYSHSLIVEIVDAQLN